MKPDKFIVLVGVAIVTIGVAHILTSLGVAETVDWPWTLGSAVAGICLAFAARPDRLLIGIGVYLVLASIVSFLRQIGALPIETAGSIQLVIAGTLIVAFQFVPNSQSVETSA